MLICNFHKLNVSFFIFCSFMVCGVHHNFLAKKALSWSWSHGSWIYNYLCNQCLSPLKLWVRIPFIARCTRYNIMWNVCRWLDLKTYHENLNVKCYYSEHRELYSNMGMYMQHTIFLMMRLKSFRPEVDKSWQSRRECQK